MALAHTDDRPAAAAEQRQQRGDRRHDGPEAGHVVAEGGTEAAGLEEEAATDRYRSWAIGPDLSCGA